MRELLGGNQGVIYPTAKRPVAPPKAFALPPPNDNMRRAFAYLIRQRHIDRDVLIKFVRAKLIYENADHHNVVFVGRDENGIAKHAHMRSTNSWGESFRLNVEGCDPGYSFHYDGKDGRLYVFEAPIDYCRTSLCTRTVGRNTAMWPAVGHQSFQCSRVWIG